MDAGDIEPGKSAREGANSCYNRTSGLAAGEFMCGSFVRKGYALRDAGVFRRMAQVVRQALGLASVACGCLCLLLQTGRLKRGEDWGREIRGWCVFWAGCSREMLPLLVLGI